MAKQQGPQMNVRKDTTTQITDLNGNIILEVGLKEYTVRCSDGSIIHRRLNENIVLVDGTVWNPGLIMRGIHVGVCDRCRRPSFFGRPTHGIVALQRARQCATCGTLCCPSHRRWSRRDHQWRCLRHHSLHLLKNLAHPIFFERKED